MIDQLRHIYPSLRVYAEGQQKLDDGFKWFLTDNNDVMGIHEQELTAKDLSLLAAFLTPYQTDFPLPTSEELQWKKAIQSSGHAELQLEHPYRFIYFSINKNQITPVFFHEAIQELFAKPVPILWENEFEGIIIENQGTDEDNPSYEKMIDILMSDLYVKINFFVGPFQADTNALVRYYESVIQTARTVFAYSNKTVMTYIDAVPFLLIDQAEPAFRQELSKSVLQESLDDEETLHMIETFVHCNLNISETAKELHMHRNSLQYRLDRLLDKTGIDIRQFPQAMTVYLAILARQ
ncbi:PucR family transcriptional regulator [Planococcus sp. YIM B11945]|uniref:PucR family transcriptional regulator n=1 Tax=Planococcus sp. YIM B11945 TaxID=3435410 RepID=UPI003D7CB36D